MIPLRVNDLKQFAYCPRIVFYNYVMPVDRKPTFKMEHGKSAEEVIDKLESRRTLKEYGLDQGKRYFHHSIFSEKLGLSGKIDLLIECPAGIFPVDFKFTAGGVRKNHIAQLAGYALILEDVYQRSVDKGFVFLIPEEKVEGIDLTDPVKTDALAMIETIRASIIQELLPDPTPWRSRCVDCEFRNYCRDVL